METSVKSLGAGMVKRGAEVGVPYNGSFGKGAVAKRLRIVLVPRR